MGLGLIETKVKIASLEKRLDRMIGLLELIAGVLMADQGMAPEEIVDVIDGK